MRDRRHIDELGRYEQVLPRLERTAIGVTVIARGLDDHARLTDHVQAPETAHRPMPDMGALLGALAVAVRATVDDVLGDGDDDALSGALDEVRRYRMPVARAAFRQAQRALAAGEAGGPDDDGADDAEPHPEGEWLSYAALLVQVDRIVGDLSAPVAA